MAHREWHESLRKPEVNGNVGRVSSHPWLWDVSHLCSTLRRWRGPSHEKQGLLSEEVHILKER